MSQNALVFTPTGYDHIGRVPGSSRNSPLLRPAACGGRVMRVLSLVVLAPCVLVCAYYYYLALSALRRQGPGTAEQASTEPRHSFAIVIPAHDEEGTLEQTLASTKQLDYPQDKYEVFVIADNCSDATAAIARDSGATCYERRDEAKFGKGFALQWGFERVLPGGSDAIVVLDADCTIDRHALLEFDRYLRSGDSVLQANNMVSNPDVNSLTYSCAVGSFIENQLYYRPKSLLGHAVFLGGTGMVFKKSVLDRFPWRAHSIAEDVEFSLTLLRNGVRIRFVPEVRVSSELPTSAGQLTAQRRRWAAGNVGVGKAAALKFIVEGIRKRSMALVDAGWTLLTLSRPLVLLNLMSALVLSAVARVTAPGTLADAIFTVTWLTAAAYALYFAIGVFLMGMNGRRFRLLLGSPLAVMRLIIISLSGLIGSGRNVWVRTPRS